MKILIEDAYTDKAVSLINNTDKTQSFGDVTVASFPNTYAADSKIYGESFSMLTQFGGTVKEPKQFTKYNDFRQYKLFHPEKLNSVFNMLIIENGENVDIYAFSSCHRFFGRIDWDENEIRMVLDLENITVAPNETVPLENILVLKDINPFKATEILSECLSRNHKIPALPQNVTGWCSWLCFGPDVTAKDVDANTKAIKDNIPDLKYVQIDDGYQAHMGDWLDVCEQFGSMSETLALIRKNGLEPAIWVAPFIADKDSALLREHPDYFVKGEDGLPLASDEFTFGGWRCAPWYMLDGTNPDACGYLTHVFKTMREEWGIKYFKLDANSWGAFSHGKRFDGTKTSVEAYRLGMDAVMRGAGEDSVILGCNAPIWQSIGAVNSMRVSCDMCRNWRFVKMLGLEICGRTWTNKLWTVDPDTVTLENQPIRQIMPDGTVTENITDGLSPDEIEYIKCAIFASGGFLLAGDDMSRYTDSHFDTLKIYLKEKHSPARFNQLDLTVGYMAGDGCDYTLLLNPDDTPVTKTVKINGKAFDLFSNTYLGEYKDSLNITLNPHSGKIIKGVKV